MTFGLTALLLLGGILAVSAAVALGARWHVPVLGGPTPQDVRGAPAAYVQR